MEHEIWSHKLVSATRQAYEGAKKRSDGILETPDGSKVNLSVSRDQLRRSLLIVDALLKAFESIDLRVSAGPSVEAFGQSITFCIRESIRTIEEEYEPTRESLHEQTEYTLFKTFYVFAGRSQWAFNSRRLSL